MVKNKKVISTLLFLITLSLCGCYAYGLEYYLILNNRLVKSGEVEINLEGGRKVLLEIKEIYGASIFSGIITTRLRLVRKPEDIEFRYDKGKGQFIINIIKDEEKTLVGIPKIDILEKDGKKSYLVCPSSSYYVSGPSPEWYGMTFEVGRIIPPSFHFIIEEKETKKSLCNVKVQAAKKWEKYRKHIKGHGYFRYYPQSDLQVSLVNGKRTSIKIKFVMGYLKFGKFRVFMDIYIPDPGREQLKILFKKAYIRDENKNLYKVSASLFSPHTARLYFLKSPKPPKEFSLFIPYILKESSEESVIKMDFKVDEEELEEFLKVIESREVPEPWKSNWFGEK